VIKPKTTDPIATIREELADYNKQIAEQNDIIQKAQSEIIRAQQVQQQAQARLLLADGASQACTVLIAKLENSDETPDPTPKS
jgi:preprotein translocase subunit SecA